MKKIFVLFNLILLFNFQYTVLADEGMWLPFLIGEKTYQKMVKKGLKLTKEQIYSANQSSLKDAVIIFGGGCTGEIVSSKGLIFTNHHCGYDAIAKVSTVEHNYLKNGFWAKNINEEIHVPDLTVQFLERIKDVTDKVQVELKNIDASKTIEELPKILNKIAQNELTETEKNTNCEARVVPMFSGNQYILFVYKRYKDVRLVGTPSESLGKFGGDTDNWEWPRHTADFSIFRVYADKNGQPADYSPDNIPLTPKYVIPVSIKGIKENSYAMTLGFPGGTNRFETSYGVKLKTSIENPYTVELRDIRLKNMMEEMKKSEAVKLKLASYYARVANYWKFFDGENKQLLKYKVLEQKQNDEQKFIEWAKQNNKAEYVNLMNEFQQCFDRWTPYSKAKVYFQEGILGSQLLSYTYRILSMLNLSKEEIIKNKEKYLAVIKELNEQIDLPSDKKNAAVLLKKYKDDIHEQFVPQSVYTSFLKDNSATEMLYQNYINNIYENTILLKPDVFAKWFENPDKSILEKDPAIQLVNAFYQIYTTKILPEFNKFQNCNFLLQQKYQKGLLEMNKGKKEFYPDANFTMRLSYGIVKSYSPKDAVLYKEVCTLKGVLEKYKPGDYEFDLPQNFVETAQKKDFGKYADKQLNDIVVTYITTNDITGGNSGSPVLNGKGELIGLAFDGNYEALSHKIHFDAQYNRTICVDIRYILWIIEKIGKADNIIKELKISA
ncbi:MAG: S46 family peptidase [Bacteroidia bacterium]|nr:S46 family peptidase [Bacteroidia bacterium]